MLIAALQDLAEGLRDQQPLARTEVTNLVKSMAERVSLSEYSYSVSCNLKHHTRCERGNATSLISSNGGMDSRYNILVR